MAAVLVRCWSSLLAASLAAQGPSYTVEVRPILAEHCFPCHGPDAAKRKARLRLDDSVAARAPRKGRPAVVPGDPQASELWQRITHPDRKQRMPPANAHKDLTAAQIETLTRWLEHGATAAPHWAWEPLAGSQPPPLRQAGWCRNVVDSWVLAGLEARGLTPAPEADRVSLVRRLHLDLTGLPPAPEQVDAFVADLRPDAYERLLDELLESPHHAEHLATQWLDLVRYADTVGYHGDQEQPITPYRDWVIDAFRANMPFDQFTVAQLAGDLLSGATTADLVATGYNRVLQTTHEEGAQDLEYRAIYAADRVRNLGTVWLGLTTGCAQCHDHKFDPIRQRDFYALAAFFADIEESGHYPDSPDASPTTRPPELVVHAAADDERARTLPGELAALPADHPRRAELERERQALEARGRRTLVTRATTPRLVRVLARGDWQDESGEVVEPGVPAFLPALGVEGRRATRRDLAVWLVSGAHPLTARVLVNRLWALGFGRGLCSLEDVGAQGTAPAHPELLDALALELVASGWNVRHVVRLIAASSAYRQSSAERPELADPDNRWLGRQTRWRVPAEAVRDIALAASGMLTRDVGGDSVRPYQPAGHWQHLNFPTRDYEPHQDHRQWRRGLYVHWQRTFLHPALAAFDAPTREECTTDRPRSATPLAALVLLNDPTFVEAARALAVRALREVPGDDAARVTRAFRLVLARWPASVEVDRLLALLAAERRVFAADADAASQLLRVGLQPVPAAVSPAELAAWTSLARALLNLPEAITRT